MGSWESINGSTGPHGGLESTSEVDMQVRPSSLISLAERD